MSLSGTIYIFMWPLRHQYYQFSISEDQQEQLTYMLDHPDEAESAESHMVARVDHHDGSVDSTRHALLPHTTRQLNIILAHRI